MQRVTILGVPIDPVTMDQAIDRIRTMLNGGKHHVMTPNSEMLVEAAQNAAFRSLLHTSALNVPDSAGLLWAARMTGQRISERIAGVDLVTELCTKLGSEHPVFLLGGRDGVGVRTGDMLRKKNPRLVIAGTFEGSPSEEDAAEIISRINDSGAHLLLVAYGAPKQDLWIGTHLHALHSVHVALGVGGTFDVVSGVVKRAPKFFRTLGFEWLWRVMHEPWRIGRILTATVRFPLLVLRYRRSAP